MTTPDTDLTPRDGDICRTTDGHLWRVTNTHGRDRVAAVSRLTDHLEMSIQYDGLTVIEPHPGGQR